LPTFDYKDLTIDEMLSGLIYVTVKSQMSDIPAILEIVRNFTLTARQDQESLMLTNFEACQCFLETMQQSMLEISGGAEELRRTQERVSEKHSRASIGTSKSVPDLLFQ